MLTVIEKVDELQKVEFFQDVRSESLAQLAAVAYESSFEAGQVLYGELHAGERMFVILEGEVTLRRDGKPCGKVCCHQMAGALAVLAGQPHRETATAAVPARALVIDEQDFYDTVADDFNLTRGVMRALARSACATSP